MSDPTPKLPVGADCPQCSKPLQRVVQSPNSMLNSEQFDAVKAGDWVCESCPDNGRAANKRFSYFWDSEVARLNAIPPEGGEEKQIFTIQEGRCYFDRLGRPVGPLEKWHFECDAPHTFHYCGFSFLENGRSGLGDAESDSDLISEITIPLRFPSPPIIPDKILANRGFNHKDPLGKFLYIQDGQGGWRESDCALGGDQIFYIQILDKKALTSDIPVRTSAILEYFEKTGGDRTSLKKCIQKLEDDYNEAINALKSAEHADDLSDKAIHLYERSIAEGWDNDPTGSMHVSEASQRANQAHTKAISLRKQALRVVESKEEEDDHV